MKSNHGETPTQKEPDDAQGKGDLAHQTPKCWATLALRQQLHNLEQEEPTQPPESKTQTIG
jgi:hypothetical protein